MVAPSTVQPDAAPPALPAITISDAERAAGRLAPERIDEAVALFAQYGALRVGQLFDPESIAALDRRYRSRYRVELRKPDMADRRRLFTVDVEGPFASPAFFANPLLFPVVQRLLGEDCILGACSSVVSWPGAPAQTVHRDSESLYGDFSIDVKLPPYAVTLLMPLVRADASTGSTRVWPGTHRVPDFETARAMPSVAHDVEPGSALLTDSRVLHAGEPNRSGIIRPLLYLTYHRAWFRDLGGYKRRPPVNLGWRRGAGIEPARRPMFRVADERDALDRARWVWRRAAARWLRGGGLRSRQETS